MGLFIKGEYVNYGCFEDFYSSNDDSFSSWLDSSSFTSSFDSDNYFRPSSSSYYDSYLPILGGGNLIYDVKS